MTRAIAVFMVVVALFLGSIAVPATANEVQAGTEVTGILEDMTETERRLMGQYLERKAKKEAAKAAKAAKEAIKEKTAKVGPKVVDKVLENVTPENLTKWGNAIGEGIKGVCSSLNVEVNAFVNTTVGKLTMGLIVYKVVGGKEIIIGVKDVVFTLLGYLFVTGILLYSYYKLHIPRKKYDYTANDKGKVVRGKDYEWEYPGKEVIPSGDMRVLSAIVHVLIFVIATIVACAAI